MTRVGTAEFKSHLSAYLRAVRRGETVIVLDRDTPVARVVPYVESGVPEQAPLDVIAAVGRAQDVALPCEPAAVGVDSLQLLMQERHADRDF